MVAVDTNLIVRLLTRDDVIQFKQSVRIFNTQDVLIPDTVILESEWVLRFAYGFESGQIIHAFKNMLGLPNVTVQNAQRISLAMDWHERGLDFADAMHLAAGRNHAGLYTFDNRFIKKAQGLTTCIVKKP